MSYTASNWYWLGQPTGQPSPIIYSSARGAVVPPTDLTYVAWSLGNFATAWPKDETGAVTVAALDEVLTAAGLPATGLSPATKPQLLAYAMTKVATVLAASRPYTVTGVTGTIHCDSGPSANDVSQALQWGSASPAPTGTLEWLDNTYTAFNLTAAEAVAFANAVGVYKLSVYAVSTPAATQIMAGAITTYAQIDALAWPV